MYSCSGSTKRCISLHPHHSQWADWISGSSERDWHLFYMHYLRLGEDILYTINHHYFHHGLTPTKTAAHCMARAFSNRRSRRRILCRPAFGTNVPHCYDPCWTNSSRLVTHKRRWLDIRVWSSWKCCLAIHDWCHLSKVWNQEPTTTVSVKKYTFSLRWFIILQSDCDDGIYDRLVVPRSCEKALEGND